MPGEILARRGHRKCGSDEPVARSLPLPSESPRTPPYHTSSRHGIWCRVSLWFGQNLRLSSPSFTSSGLGGREGAEPKQNLSQPLKLQVAPSSLGDSRQACPSGQRALGERAHSLCSTRAAGGRAPSAKLARPARMRPPWAPSFPPLEVWLLQLSSPTPDPQDFRDQNSPFRASVFPMCTMGPIIETSTSKAHFGRLNYV